MREWLSLVLSVCILLSSITPSFSQGIIGRNLGKVSGLGVSSMVSKEISSSISRSVLRQTSLMGRNIPQLVAMGKVQGLPAKILHLEVNNSFRASLLRNEFVKLSVLKIASPAERLEAFQFYNTNLQKSLSAFALVQGKELNEILTTFPIKDLLNFRNLFSDVAAIALTGTEKNAISLVKFHQQAVGSAFEQAATVLVARGLIRLKAYTVFNDWAKTVKQEGPFWQGLERYCKENGIPVSTHAVEGESFAFPTQYEIFLKSGSELNALNADESYEATKQWIELSAKDIHFKQDEVASSQQEVSGSAVSVPALEQDLSLNLDNLSLEQVSLAPHSVSPLQAEETSSDIVATEEPVAPTQVDNGSTNVYSGVPVFAIGKAIKNIFSKIKNYFHKEPTYDFQLTVADAEGKESILPVNLSIEDEVMSGAKKEGYDRVTFAFNPHFHNGYIAEFRNKTHNPQQLGHFHMRLQADQVGLLVNLLKKYGSTTDLFRLKLEKNPNVNYSSKIMSVFDLEGNLLPLEVEVPQKYFSQNSKLILLKDGSLGLLAEGEMTPKPLTDFYVRLPKNQIKAFVNLVKYSEESFDISLKPTKDRTDILVRDVSLTSVGIGKTMGPIVHGPLNVSVGAATGMMFAINYVFPGFASLLTPVLKKYGEKKLLTASMLMTMSSGLLATLAGFHGSILHVTVGPLQKVMFVAALFLLSGAGILKQLVTNMLIRANRADVILDKVSNEATDQVGSSAQEQLQGMALLKSRMKNLFSTKIDVNFKDVILYNMSFTYKNIGALAFLSIPFLLNFVSKIFTGESLGLDFSVSFPLLAAYSGLTTWKVMRAKLRDAYSAKNLIESESTLTNAIETSVKKLLESSRNGIVAHSDIDDVARSIKNAMDDLTFATLKINPEQMKKEIFSGLKENALDVLETRLIEGGMNPQEAKSLLAKITASLNRQENVLGNLWETFKLPGVVALSTAMTLATVHEFVISSSFASTMRELIPQGEFANFTLALSLYLPLIAGRLGGNFISRYLSSGSMYILCSTLSAIGTGIMIGAGGSVTQSIVGAVVASLGVGNFFTQMYDYIMKQYPKHNRELSSVLALTMGIAGFLSMPAGFIAGAAGWSPDLVYAALALMGSLTLTPGIMANSTLFKVAKYEFKKIGTKIKNFFTKRNGSDHSGPIDGAILAN